MTLAEILTGILEGKQFQWNFIIVGWEDIEYSFLFDKLSSYYDTDILDDSCIRIKSDFNISFDRVIDELKDYIHDEELSVVQRDTIEDYLERLEVIVHTAINKGEIK